MRSLPPPGAAEQMILMGALGYSAAVCAKAGVAALAAKPASTMRRDGCKD
jgi:hypothetical protein